MKAFLKMFCLALLPLSVGARAQQATEGNTPQMQYIARYAALAVAEMQRSGIPASITLAQGMLESDAGRSELAVKANNHFGIKCHKGWSGERHSRDDDRKNECFRVYPSVEASFQDHSDFLRYRDRYKSLFELDPGDYKGWARGLKAAGYATDKAYAEKLIRQIEQYDLTRFDRQAESPLPEAPGRIEQRSNGVLGEREQERCRFALSRPVYERNGVPCIYAVEGDSYASIAESNNLFLKELLFFNDLREPAALEPGTLVYLHAKKRQAAKGLEKHIVGEDGETLRDIAQRYGVREKALRRLNALSKDYTPAEGEMIRLRK
ncbi:MAG: glucosaminidase domain-containing protein [Bacteroidales bacterium]|nr:glucosaminidase domain-containing protein [Bacteroidales bacterium]